MFHSIVLISMPIVLVFDACVSYINNNPERAIVNTPWAHYIISSRHIGTHRNLSGIGTWPSIC